MDFISKAHSDALNAAAKRVVGGDAELRGRLRHIGALFLHRDTFSDGLTGLVFAGFGGKELFPSLQAVEVDGIIAGRLKQKVTHKTDIDREVSRNGDVDRRLVQIIPFAQTDMAQRFLEGIDPRLEREIVRSVEAAHREALDTFRKSHPNLSQEAADTAAALLDTYLGETLAHIRDVVLDQHKSSQKSEIENMTLMMPKQELAFLAEAIIN